MNRQLLSSLILGMALALAATAQQIDQQDAKAPSAEEIVARYAAARGGTERWQQVQSLRATGSYSAFSFKAPFTLIRQRGDLYRLDFEMLQTPAVRARDGEGAWALHKLLWPEPTRLVDSPYIPQFERESTFASLLLDHDARGLAVESLGPGEIDGIATIGLKITLADHREEIWHLDADTYLEVAIESRVVDFTQASEPVRQRTFFDDFRPVDGLVLPHWVEHEFNHRLESMTIESWEVNPALEPELFSPPASE